MKMIKSCHILLFFTLLSYHGAAQNSGIFWRTLNSDSNRLDGKLTGETYFISSFENDNYFLQKGMVNANITFLNGEVFENILVQYHAYNDDLIAYNSNLRSLLKVDKAKVKEFVVLDEKFPKSRFVKLPFVSLGKKERYFEVLYEGVKTLLVFHKIEAQKVSPYMNKHGILSDTKYKLNQIYYVYSGPDEFQKIKPKRRSFYHTFPEQKKEIKKVFRKSKINIMNESSLIQAFSLLDEAKILN